MNMEKIQAIAIEPGLFEWLAWYRDSLPDWMSTEDLQASGYNILSNYRPIVQRKELQGRKESVKQLYERGFNLAKNVIKRTADVGGNILLVGHAPTLDICSRQLTGSPPRAYEAMNFIIKKIPYCGMITISETGNHSWKFCDLPFPQITHTENRYFDRQLLQI